MLEKIAKVVNRYDDIEKQMSDPKVLADHVRLTELAQERSDLMPLVDAFRQHERMKKELAGAHELLGAEEDNEMIALVEDEIAQVTELLDALEGRMRSLLVPKDPRDGRNVFIEIRAGAGGDEAGIFAADLLRAYLRYAESRNWKTSIVDESSTGVGGYKEVILAVKGKGAYSRFKFESGVHRVQRVPQTESQGRIHTSTATVAVMPEVDDVDITLDERTWRSPPLFPPGRVASTCKRMRRPLALFTSHPVLP
jgi:peptide chain release factor 1